MKLNKFFIAAFAAAAVLSSCGEQAVDDANPDANKAKEGIPTYASFKFFVTGASRAALSPDNGEVAVPALSRVDILIFKNTGSFVCEKKISLTGAQAVVDPQPVLVTSGTKKIFIICNAPTSAQTKLTSITENLTTLSEFMATTSEIDLIPASNDLSVLSSYHPSNMPLSNAIDEASTFILEPSVSANEAETANPSNQSTHPSGKNSFNIKVKRMLAKVQVLHNTATVVSGGQIVAVDGAGTAAELRNLAYTVRNVRRSGYLLMQRRAGTETPAYDPAIDDPKSVLVPYDAATSALIPGTITQQYSALAQYFFSQSCDATDATKSYDYLTTLPGGTLPLTNPVPGPFYYVTENVNLTPRWGNTTLAVVRATYLPKAGKYVTSCGYDMVNDAFSPVTGTSDITTATTLYKTLKGGPGLPAGSLFTNVTEAYRAGFSLLYPGEKYDNPGSSALWTAFQAADAAGIALRAQVLEEYNQGTCYYQVFFGRGKVADNSLKYGVIRNGAYTAMINKFNGIGTSTEDGSNPPVTPLTQETYVDVTIIIQGWDYVEGQYEL
ncbi:MAG: Mfa1 family fimbria major subunit [Rikenellaceae bacterium]|jgi:hypothetical protein|nr:Mfa1 family fimbria major subunit [Rikenellaceae bacterium]